MTTGGQSVCPECEGPVDPATQQFCPRCGYPVVSLPAGPGAAAQPDPEAAQYDDSPTAVIDLPVPDSPPAPGADDLTCPACAHRNSPDRVRCAVCGTPIGVVASLVELPPSGPAPEPRLARDRWPVVVAVLAVLALVLVAAGIFVSTLDSSRKVTDRLKGNPVQPVRVPSDIVEARSSSHLRTDNGLTYFACNMVDGDASTAWNSESDKAAGSILTFRFARPVELRSITMVNGYAKDELRFTSNSAVSAATVLAGDETFAWTPDADSTDPQTLSEDFGVVTDLGVRVDGVRQGTEHTEVAITEIWFEEMPPSGSSATVGPSRAVDVSCPPESR